jgi:hypothetical protein
VDVEGVLIVKVNGEDVQRKRKHTANAYTVPSYSNTTASSQHLLIREVGSSLLSHTRGPQILAYVRRAHPCPRNTLPASPSWRDQSG